MMVDGTEFWTSCKQPSFLCSFSHLQLIQNLAPSTIMWIGIIHPRFLKPKGFDPIVEIIGAFQFHASIAEALAKFSWDLDTW